MKMSLQHEDRKSKVKLVRRVKKHGVDRLREFLGHAKPRKLSDHGGLRSHFDSTEYRCNHMFRVLVAPLYVPLSTQLTNNPDSL